MLQSLSFIHVWFLSLHVTILQNIFIACSLIVYLGYLYVNILCVFSPLEYKIDESRNFFLFVHCFIPSTQDKAWHLVVTQ